MVPMHARGERRGFMRRGSSNDAAAGLRPSRGPWIVRNNREKSLQFVDSFFTVIKSVSTELLDDFRQ
jgi:hypothetical protein